MPVRDRRNRPRPGPGVCACRAQRTASTADSKLGTLRLTAPGEGFLGGVVGRGRWVGAGGCGRRPRAGRTTGWRFQECFPPLSPAARAGRAGAVARVEPRSLHPLVVRAGVQHALNRSSPALPCARDEGRRILPAEKDLRARRHQRGVGVQRLAPTADRPGQGRRPASPSAFTEAAVHHLIRSTASAAPGLRAMPPADSVRSAPRRLARVLRATALRTEGSR